MSYRRGESTCCSHAPNARVPQGKVDVATAGERGLHLPHQHLEEKQGSV